MGILTPLDPPLDRQAIDELLPSRRVIPFGQRDHAEVVEQHRGRGWLDRAIALLLRWGGLVETRAASSAFVVPERAATARAEAVLIGHAGPVVALAFASDGRTLASASRDGDLRLWDAGGGRALGTLPSTAVTRRLAFSPDGGVIAAASSRGDVGYWEVVSSRELYAAPGETSRSRWSPPRRRRLDSRSRGWATGRTPSRSS
jgi:hypothetical protein